MSQVDRDPGENRIFGKRESRSGNVQADSIIRSAMYDGRYAIAERQPTRNQRRGRVGIDFHSIVDASTQLPIDVAKSAASVVRKCFFIRP